MKKMLMIAGMALTVSLQVHAIILENGKYSHVENFHACVFEVEQRNDSIAFIKIRTNPRQYHACAAEGKSWIFYRIDNSDFYQAQDYSLKVSGNKEFILNHKLKDVESNYGFRFIKH